MLPLKQIDTLGRFHAERLHEESSPVRQDLTQGWQGWPCCGVFACALLHPKRHSPASVFSVARNVLGRSRNWKGRMHLHELRQLFEHFGIRRAELEGYQGYSVPKVCAELQHNTAYLLEITRHFCVLYQGRIYDQQHPQGLDVATSPYPITKRVKNVWRIL